MCFETYYFDMVNTNATKKFFTYYCITIKLNNNKTTTKF